jgi:hypothetical protein
LTFWQHSGKLVKKGGDFMLHANFIAVLVGAIINMVVGAVWYSPLLFAKEWMKLTGKKMTSSDKNAANKMYGISFVISLVLSYVLAHFLFFTSAHTAVEGVKTALWVWVGFVTATQLPSFLFEGRPTKLFAINAGYYLVSLVIMGAVLANWA